jgi:uncharacterized heparinase superfamily protein
MRLARVWRMPPAEIAFRGRAEARKWLERCAGPPITRRNGPRAPFAEFLAACAPRFFAGALSDDTALLLSRRAPEECAGVIATADAACRGRFDLLGYRDVDFGRPIDWHFDPLAGRRVPRVHWSRIQPLDAARAGDCKLIWELNRHQWMLALGQAYRLTGDDRYASAFAGYVREWLAANPRGCGINWTSSLELAFRLVAWCWALAFFRGAPDVGPELFAALRDSLTSHAAHVAAFPSHYSSPNTHLTGEALGLFYAGLLFPEDPAAPLWRDAGARILIAEIERQVFEDGVYFEQSTAYQCYTVEIYLHFLILAARNGVRVPSKVAERVQSLLDFLLFVRRPDGSLPAIGDGDGGRLLPVVRRRPDDARGVFAVAAAFFKRADYAWAAGGAASEVLWLLGSEGLAALDALDPQPPPGSPSRAFPTGGYVVFRSGWDRTAHQLIFDAGPLGCPVTGAHGHADLLSIQVSAFGQAFVVDPGTYVYTADAALRDHFRGSLAHSTVTIDGASQARPAGTFAWRERPRARLRDRAFGGRIECATADHGGYEFLGRAVHHRRQVLFVDGRFWLVVDDVSGEGRPRVEQRFQFAPLTISIEPSGWVRAEGQAGARLWLRAQATAGLALEAHLGTAEPTGGWVSPDYGQRLPAPAVVWSARAALPLRIVTTLLPMPADQAPPDVALVEGPDGTPVGVVDGDDRVLFQADRPAVA